MLYEAARMAEDGHISYEPATGDPYLARYAQGWGRPGDIGVGAFDIATGLPVGAAWVRVLVGQDHGTGGLDEVLMVTNPNSLWVSYLNIVEKE